MRYKKIVQNSLLIGALIVILNISVLEWFTRTVLIPNDVIHRKEQLLLEKKESIQIVSLGDSHVERGMDIDRADYFNFSIANEPIPIWYFKAKWLVENVEDLKVLILPMDYHIFSYYRTANIEHVTRQYKKYIDEEVDLELGVYPSPNTKEKIPLYSLQSNYAPIVYRTFFEYSIGALNKPRLNENGTSPRLGTFSEDPPEKRLKDTKIRVNEHLYSKFLVHEKLVDYYEKIIEMAQSNGIKVVLIRFPLSNEYLSLVNKEVENEFSRVIQHVQENHDVEVLDYRKVFENEQEFFKDHDHLNADGAKRFGSFVVGDLVLEQ